MKIRELAWGVTAWPVVATIVGAVLGGWDDIPVLSAVAILGGTAAASAVTGLGLWLPLVWRLNRFLPSRSPLLHASAYFALGAGVGGALSSCIVLLSGNAVWPTSAGVVAIAALTAGVASVSGWGLALAVRSGQVPRRGRMTFNPAR